MVVVSNCFRKWSTSSGKGYFHASRHCYIEEYAWDKSLLERIPTSHGSTDEKQLVLLAIAHAEIDLASV